MLPGLNSRRRSSALRTLIDRPGALVVPGAVDALSARLVERAGFEACYVSGAGVANVELGLPDVGLLTMSEMLHGVRHIADAVSIPVIVDGDTGHGGLLSVMRTVHQFEAAGAAAIQLEDQEMPKRCGHFDGKVLVGQDEMVSRISAAIEARSSDDFLVIARTDARATEGVDQAIQRANAYGEAGADVLFVEAPMAESELEIVGRELRHKPLLVNIVEGGRTPELPAQRLEELGFSVILHANFLMRAMVKAGQRALNHLNVRGETLSLHGEIISWDERQELVNLSRIESLERRLMNPPRDGVQQW